MNINRPSVLRSRPFFRVLNYALSHAVLFALANTLILLLLKGFAASQGAAQGESLIPSLPFYCGVALVHVGVFIIATVLLTTFLNFTVPPFAGKAANVTGIAWLLSLVLIVPAHVGAYFFTMATEDSSLGHFTSYIAYFLLPGIFLLITMIRTAHFIRRLTIN